MGRGDIRGSQLTGTGVEQGPPFHTSQVSESLGSQASPVKVCLTATYMHVSTYYPSNLPLDLSTYLGRYVFTGVHGVVFQGHVRGRMRGMDGISFCFFFPFSKGTSYLQLPSR